jgi:TetR/AcrR family transcriptional regulator, transcriptional repressor for nem operon
MMPRTGGHLTRERIIEKATDLFRRTNYHTVGLTEILSSCGISKGTFYFYFESKQELCEACIALLGAMMRRIGTESFSGCSWRQGVERFVLHYLGSYNKPRPFGMPLTHIGLELAYTNPVLLDQVATLLRYAEKAWADQLIVAGLPRETADGCSGTVMAAFLGHISRMTLTRNPRFALYLISQLENVPLCGRQSPLAGLPRRAKSPSARSENILDFRQRIWLDIVDERSIIGALNVSGAAQNCADGKRLEILYKAAELFWERGYHATDLKSILAECRVPKGSFQFYYKSKKALATAVLEFYRLRCETVVNKALSRPDWGNSVEDLCAAVARIQKGGSGLGCPLGNMGLEFANSDRAAALKVGAILQVMEDAFVEVFQRRMDSGEARERAAYAVALLHGHEIRALIYDDPNVVSELRESLLALSG